MLTRPLSAINTSINTSINPDADALPPIEYGLPAKFTSWRDQQLDAIYRIINSDKRFVTICMPTGCLTGDTEIHINRGGAAKRVTLAREYYRQTCHAARRHPSVVPHTRSFTGERIGLHPFECVVERGRRETWEMILDNGKSIRGTPEHLVLTPSGFVQLCGLRKGSKVICDTPRPVASGKPHFKPRYRRTQGLIYHPFANNLTSYRVRVSPRGTGRIWAPEGRLYSVAYHRLVAEAKTNGISVGELIRICRTDKFKAGTLAFLDPAEFVVHHKDENPKNNVPSNLDVLTHDAHWLLHADIKHFRQGVPTEVRVLSCRPTGLVEDVYDLLACAPHENFVANGIVVHNSGKSLMSVGAALLSGRRTVLLTATKGLQDQVRSDFSECVADIRGLANYTCPISSQLGIPSDTSVADAPCQCGYVCRLRHGGCGFYDSYRRAQCADVTVTNYQMWMNDGMRSSEERGNLQIGIDSESDKHADMLIMDEIHDGPEQLSKFIGEDISRRECLQLHLPWPDAGGSVDDWCLWAMEQMEGVAERLKDIEGQLRNGRGSGSGWSKELKHLRDMKRKLERLSAMRAEDEWILTESDVNVEAGTMSAVRFDPLSPARYAESALFRGIEKIVLVSATVRPKTAAMLGIAAGDMEFVEYPSTFPVERRPVVHVPTCRMTYHNEQNDDLMFEWLKQLDDWIGQRLSLGRKGLVHAVSYKRAKFILDNSAHSRRMMTHSAWDRARVVEEFRRRADACCLVSPSIDTGYDFPNCPTPDTRVLTTDLTWKPIGDVLVGDTIAAFDEEHAYGRRERRWRTATVLRKGLKMAPCYRLIVDDGAELICTEDHKWLCRRDDGGIYWITTKGIRAGHANKWITRLCKLCPVWGTGNDRDTGYLAGAFDGEGHLYSTIERSGTLTTLTLAFAQTENPMLYEVQKILCRKGFIFDVYHRSREKTERPRKDGFNIRLHDRSEAIRFLGEIRPVRLLPKFSLDKMGAVRNVRHHRVLAKEFIGMREVVAMETTTHTYIAEGFGSHNRQARFQVIAKLPFGSVTDPVIKARKAKDQDYDLYQVAQTLVQMTGRIVRSESDYGETLIADQSVEWAIPRMKAKGFLPVWWLKSFVSLDVAPEPIEFT